MFWIVTCFIYPRVFTIKRDRALVTCLCIKYFEPRAPQRINPALHVALELHVDSENQCNADIHVSTVSCWSCKIAVKILP